MNPVPLTVPDADSVVNAPVLAVVEPIGPGDANVAPPSVAALMLELHENPAALVHNKAFVDALQLGTASAVGVAVPAVPLPSTVLADCVARPVSGMDCHVGAELAPLEMIACPAADPEGFSSWTGDNVAAPTTDAKAAIITHRKNRFMDFTEG